jgi:ABC-type sugar transport system ATPase subunit
LARISLKDIHVRFGDVAAVDGVNLEIEDGEFVVFLGPSGCGKTTTLRCIAGLEEATSGDILFDGKPVNALDAIDRNVAMVFQFVSLYPHLTIRKNIAFPLEARGTPRTEIAEKVQWVSGIFGLGDILDQRPRKLPPGARQKAALARAVVREPNVLLLDEPLSAIDEQFREEMRWELRHLQKRLGVTSIYVTHDQREAMSLADRIVLMRDGRIVQVGPPAELYSTPADAFAGYFIGSPAMNFITAKRDGNTLLLEGSGTSMALPERLLSAIGGQDVQLGIRPQHVSAAQSKDAPGCFVAKVIDHYTVGREHWFDFELAGKVYKGAAEVRGGRTGEDIVVKLDLDHLHLFTAGGERLLAARSA